MQAAIPVFYSYSHKDEPYREVLETQLGILKRKKYIEDWNDRRIDAGSDWEHEINLHLQDAKIVLLLVSSNFLASNYCYDSETIFALEQHKNNECVVIPIILKPCLWKESDLKTLHVLPKDGRPITSWENEDEAWLDVAEGILAVIKKYTSDHVSKKEVPSKGSLAFEAVDEYRKAGGGIAMEFDKTLLQFLKTYNRWYFSPLRIQKWGGQQQGFETLLSYDTHSIKTRLEHFLAEGEVKSVRSKQGNIIYKIK